MGRPMFEKLVMKLEENPIFVSQGRKPQRPVRYQLATFLIRYGTRGSDAMNAAKKMGIGLGSVWLYCRRVTRALRELGVKAISWGDENRHNTTAAIIEELSGLPDCIGIIDGSLIRLTEIPGEWGTVYFCRKKYPAVCIFTSEKLNILMPVFKINVQAVCDHQKRFISYDMGWPGSMTDVTILKNSHLWKNRSTHFSGNEYILADRGMFTSMFSSMYLSKVKGYPSSPYLLRPFTEPEINEHQGAERSRRFQFNKTVSGVRVWIEHAFGMLKGRFLSLKDFGQHDNVQEIYKVIQALMTVHNLCIDWGDSGHDFLARGRAIHPEDDLPDGDDVEVTGYGGVEIEVDQAEQVPSYETDDWHRDEGHRKRNAYLDELYPL